MIQGGYITSVVSDLFIDIQVQKDAKEIECAMCCWRPQTTTNHGSVIARSLVS